MDPLGHIFDIAIFLNIFAHFPHKFHKFHFIYQTIWLKSMNREKLSTYWAIPHKITFNLLKFAWFFAKIDYFSTKFTIATNTHRKRYHFNFLRPTPAQWDQNKSIWYIDHSSRSNRLVFIRGQSSRRSSADFLFTDLWLSMGKWSQNFLKLNLSHQFQLKIRSQVILM